MSRRPRRNHSPAFKAKVALEAIRGDKTIAEIAHKHDVHPNQVTDWPALGIRALHAKIGQLALENDSNPSP
jgi:transposase